MPLRWLLVRDPAGRFRPQALLSADPDTRPADLLAWFICRWPIEATFAEVRRHLGVETQGQWTDRAIARTTPMLLALSSLVTLFADDIHNALTIVVRSARWYAKEAVTFGDAPLPYDDNYGKTRLSPCPDTTRPRRKLQMASSTA